MGVRQAQVISIALNVGCYFEINDSLTLFHVLKCSRHFHLFCAITGILHRVRIEACIEKYSQTCYNVNVQFWGPCVECVMEPKYF